MLLPQDGVDGLQEVLSALWRAGRDKTGRENKRGIFLARHSVDNVGRRRIRPSSRGNSIKAHLQHSWKVLSGRPSDSDLVWTISHTEEPSPSEVGEG